ncbi:hypothetical protein DPMN_181734 [Dreissena polymorpha]|uniref:Uncharacterized protein n=1 Tax=Dreissena polymorpha TaxID=45954 RepID=A0A9D4I418_DREPO|nr:hypothetical protein DPMN_181734 [Dreissena polymorpha]
MECDQCDNLFSEESDKLLTCDYCSKHRCLKCLNVTTAVYKAIHGRALMPWFCHLCVKKSLNVTRENKTIEDRCSDFLSEFEQKMNNRMKKLENDMVDIKHGIDNMKEDIIKDVKGSHTVENQVSDINSMKDEIIKEVCQSFQSENKGKGSDSEKLEIIKDIINRRINIIFQNIEEYRRNLKGDRIKHDTNEIKGVGNEIGINLQDEDILNVRRIWTKGTL